MPRISNTWYDFFLFNTVSMFMSGALSLTAITLNRLVGIMMPKLANILELNRSIVYCILGVIWLISFGAAIPTFDYRRYDVSFEPVWIPNDTSIMIWFVSDHIFQGLHTIHLCRG